MQLNYAQGEYPFPDEFAPVKKKIKPEYGVQAAKAMYYSKNRQGYSIFATEDDGRNYDALIELAQGRQSTDNIRRLFGFYDQKATSQDDKSLAYIDVQVINLATKYVNRAVAKLQKHKYKLGLSAVDPESVDQVKEYDAKIKAYYELKSHFEAMGQNAQQFFDDLEIGGLPEYPEEMMFNLTANRKIRKVVDGEKTIQLVSNTMNDMSQIMREFDWDDVVLGHGHIHCYLDENGMPRAENINAKYWGGSYVDNEDHKKQEYSFFIDFISVNQFRKEAEGKLTPDQIETVLRSHAWPNTATTYSNLPDAMYNYDGLTYIPVMRFYFLSNDHTAHAIWKNEDGNTMIADRHYNYKPSPNSKKTDQKVVKNVYTSVYGGSWVVDSDIVYNYGKKDIPRSNLVDTRLPIISFAPNMKNGRYVSLLSQMVEPLTMINVAWNKIKSILAKERIGIMELNLTAFENLALGKGGTNWSAREAVEYLMQTNIAVTRQQMNPYGGSIGKNVSFQSTGVTIADYFNTISQAIRFLDDLSGSTLAETNELPDRLTSKTMMANVAAGSDAIEYLVNAHTQVYYQTTHMLLLLTQEAKRNKTVIKGMIPALGKYTTEYFEVPDELPYTDYGLSLEREATPEEWAEFYAEIAAAVQKGLLNASDSAFLREIPNMTQARFAMANRELLNEKKAAKALEADRKFQFDIAGASAEAKLKAELQIQEKKKADEMELKALQGKIDEVLIEKEAMFKAEIAGMSDVVRKSIERQKGIDSILREAMRARSENYKTDKQAASKIATSMISSQQKKEEAPKKPVKK